jgi:hypothetical protein
MKQAGQGGGASAPRQPEQRARPPTTPIPDVAGPYVPIGTRPMPASEKLKLAAGIAATVGLLTGEVLNELRRRRFDRRLVRRT